MSRPDPRTRSLEERLRAALEAPLERIPHGVDMSARAITGRLRDACEMSTLALMLGPRTS